MASRVVLDTSAVLALLFQEPGADVVADLGSKGLLSTVSYSETLAKSLDRGAPLEIVERMLSKLQLTIVPFDRDHAIEAGAFRPLTRHLNASFADRACLATAKLAALSALVAERQWAKEDLGVEIILIR